MWLTLTARMFNQKDPIMTDTTEEIRQFLESIPDTFRIMETGVDIETQKEYLDYSESLGRGELTEEGTSQLATILSLPEATVTSKKKGLTLLAHLGTISAYRHIEKYYQNPDPEIKSWAALALEECRMFLESTLLDESVGLIVSGLGGTADKMRFYFMVLPTIGTRFTPEQYAVIEIQLRSVASELNCIAENFYPSDTSVGFTALVPHNLAVGTFIEAGMHKCNELGELVFEHYYVTNQNIPDRAEVAQIIGKIME